jgi:hypothetical protein
MPPYACVPQQTQENCNLPFLFTRSIIKVWGVKVRAMAQAGSRRFHTGVDRGRYQVR